VRLPIQASILVVVLVLLKVEIKADKREIYRKKTLAHDLSDPLKGNDNDPQLCSGF
jgi:hypothetical protein